MRTDGRSDVKNLIVAFRNFARGPKTYKPKNKFIEGVIIILPSQALPAQNKFE